ncbi:hypothetical protein BU25DRAFT_45756 [Macroventuria anomochaeta]|uniref:Uncharacterized protein n=1 Tax=Macroventuria anomochaeta TaxID=301207 RepID=A0ACB6S2W4_9PLEO|nr:uncharacterized protein BU25DRAFT_45756 [Macroventuria anomochaeta]KAF2627867.1 hypothetical protein BU25DRAFT_45756 [Macroventuria anomochaeta]
MYIASRHAALMASCSTSSINFVIGISLALEPDSILCTTHCNQSPRSLTRRLPDYYEGYYNPPG